MGKSYEDHADTAMPPDAAMRAVSDAIGAIAKSDSVRVDGWAVTAAVGMNWKSWGEKLSGRVLTGPGGTRVEVTSECRFPLQRVDYGRNRQNVERILSAFR